LLKNNDANSFRSKLHKITLELKIMRLLMAQLKFFVIVQQGIFAILKKVSPTPKFCSFFK